MRNIDKSEAERVAGSVNMSDSGEPEKNFIIFGEARMNGLII
ncbi:MULTISPECIES: hypothetical protein [Pantoea]|nr:MULTISPECIES: hypothetical protein [Pantoea]